MGAFRLPHDFHVPAYLPEIELFKERDFDRPTRYGTPHGGTGNVLIARTAIELMGGGVAVFRPKFALTGGGDTDFFVRAHRAGAKIVQAKESMVIRNPGSARATLGGILRHAFRIGNSRMIMAAEHFSRDQYIRLRRHGVKEP